MMDHDVMRSSSDPNTEAPRNKAERDDVRSLLADLMPWAATILLHGAMVLIAILIVWATLDRKPVEDPFEPTMSTPTAEKGSLRFKEDQSFTKNIKDVRNTTTEIRETKVETTLVKAPPLWGVNGSNADAHHVFTPPGGGAVGSGTIFVGPDDQIRGAKSFAFVIDASGSMLDTLPLVIVELKKTIRSIHPKHAFTVVFYQNDTVIECLAPGLKEASPENVDAAMNWLDSDALSPGGLSSPVKAIEHTLKYKPEVMFLLSDNITGSGRWELHQDELLARILKARTGKTKINTIQFLYPDPLTRFGRKPTMQRISEETNGVYKFYSAKDLGL